MQNDYSSYTNSTKINVISVCVCVDRLKRRKTSTRRGAVGIDVTAQRRRFIFAVM